MQNIQKVLIRVLKLENYEKVCQMLRYYALNEASIRKKDENKKLDIVIKIDGGNILKILCFEQNADDAIDISSY